MAISRPISCLQICAHAFGRNSVLSSSLRAMDQVVVGTPQISALHIGPGLFLPWVCFQRSNTAWYFVKANCLYVIPCCMLHFTSDKQMGIHSVGASAWLPWDFLLTESECHLSLHRDCHRTQTRADFRNTAESPEGVCFKVGCSWFSNASVFASPGNGFLGKWNSESCPSREQCFLPEAVKHSYNRFTHISTSMTRSFLCSAAKTSCSLCWM